MQRSEIIELCNQLTERKGEKQLNLQSLYRIVTQDICNRQRFWWRRLTFSFNLVVGQPTYDLTQVTPTPANANVEILFEEITKLSLLLSPNPLQLAQLVPVFDPETLVEMINNTSLTSPTSGNPNSPGGRYTMDVDYKTLRLDPPDNAYQAFIVGWAMPNPGTDSTNDNVPLIPPWGHKVIVSGLNAKIFKFAYGSKNPKTIDAQEEYEQGIMDLTSKRQFDPNYRLQMNLNESAVRST